jgi:hypothetical protein
MTMNVDQMITLATEVMLDLDEIEEQFLGTTVCEDCYPRLKAAEDEHSRLYESLHATLDEQQRKLLLALDDNLGDRLCAKTSLTLATGVIIGLKYVGFPDERIKSTLAVVLPNRPE